MGQKVVGVFQTEHEAVSAINALKAQGIHSDNISIIGKDNKDVDSIAAETDTKMTEGVAVGAATGGVVGGVTGLLAGLGALVIPGIGPLLAAGPIVAALTGAAVGAGAGGLVGGLVGLGIPEHEAAEYNSYVNDGNILVLVDDHAAEVADIEAIFCRHGSRNSSRYGAMGEHTL
ncbi:MAG: general stress protein [Gorillibacterium sp.]|nr:general stress protein [Gorillibacterium sp.]